MVKSGIENPSKSGVIGRCGGDDKKRMTTQNGQKSTLKKECQKWKVCQLTGLFALKKSYTHCHF